MPVSKTVNTLSDRTKSKVRAPRMRAYSEKDEKGNLCAGHFKRYSSSA